MRQPIIHKCGCSKNRKMVWTMPNMMMKRFYVMCDTCGKRGMWCDSENAAILHWNKIAKIL